jgi:hemoglobin
MTTSHQGMGVSESDWQVFIGHVEASLATFEVPATEHTEVLAFVGGLKSDVVE